MIAITFVGDDLRDQETVRAVVLRRLKEDHEFGTWNPQNSDHEARNFGRWVAVAERDQRRFTELADHVMWDLIVERVITPGSSASINRGFPPWFRLTPYGRKVIDAERPSPNDPTGYLGSLAAGTGSVYDQTAAGYADEALRCYNAGCYSASALLIGVAAERVMLNLVDVGGKVLSEAPELEQFRKLSWQVSKRHEWIRTKIQQLPEKLRRELQTDIAVTTLYELIRRQRNDLGHPQDTPPTIPQPRAFDLFQCLLSVVTDAARLADYLLVSGWHKPEGQ